MLRQINIKNFAIIDNLDLELKSGMTVVTGETGAGKSIVIDALDVALGDRADSKMIRHGCDRCEIALTFDITHIPAAQQWLQAKDFDNENNEVLIRRVTTTEGRSRNYINGQSATLQQLRDMGKLLIHIHAQHENQSLIKKDEQRQLLDAYANHTNLLNKVSEHYQHWQHIKNEITQLQTGDTDTQARLELLTYQVNELDALQLQENEIDTLHAEHKLLANADTLLTNYQQALNLLTDNDDATILSQLYQVRSILADNADHMKDIIELLQNAEIQITEASQELRHYFDSVEVNPQRLQEVESRLALLHDTARKHKVTPEQLYERQLSLQTELSNLQNCEQRLAELIQQEQSALTDYLSTAKRLQASRKKASKKLNKLVSDSIQRLGMPEGHFAIDITEDKNTNPTIHGIDHVQFMVSANPGQPLRPLAKVASGGEMSRISLAIQVITAQTDATPSLIFDEVDVGIGGGTAEIVGQLLKKLGHTAQVLCITHLPQVAAQGDHHLMIGKHSVDNSTASTINFLSPEARIDEIARMLGGVKITQQTLAHAKEMLAVDTSAVVA